MIKFVISGERIADVCTIAEYIGVIVGNPGAQMKVLPKVLVDDNNNYVVEVKLNDDGDIAEINNLEAAERIMEGISVRRFEKLRKELTEAAKNIVNPPKGGS